MAWFIFFFIKIFPHRIFNQFQLSQPLTTDSIRVIPSHCWSMIPKVYQGWLICFWCIPVVSIEWGNLRSPMFQVVTCLPSKKKHQCATVLLAVVISNWIGTNFCDMLYHLTVWLNVDSCCYGVFNSEDIVPVSIVSLWKYLICISYYVVCKTMLLSKIVKICFCCWRGSLDCE